MDTVEIGGNTFPVREELKTLGARWNGDRNVWLVPAAKGEEARALVSGVGPRRHRGGLPAKCFSAREQGPPAVKGSLEADVEEAGMAFVRSVIALARAGRL